MISQLNSAGIRNAYASNFGESREVSQKSSLSVSKQGDLSKVEQIKGSLESGEYKVNLQALSEKIAEELI
ncbi:MAG: flagellar biosynthesis protein FlgM [Sulfurimonas sp. RIFOXYD12_FULL_36_11]|jgi:anti-sigma28 factor (negative regulator of flagellin synthesis)|uniref:flagellar biosynthesis anti-sigma factor FlgM n=1 Tax=Sulfurimonas sp. RIFOXYB12_FULL_35_9 TaxID=1802256 RepID=UPI0008AE2CCF|nr:flagellar biosynthesis anti-sigma factor FlgM [Sulfurimonas sp. RIFOXYB12_FULL_35_9]OHE05328.1 MAG: flagellar biosynthesis protein FlgM [Sulfurimonas sp. RIFOXYB12_FULL_35_9]OHE08455.1 MAG: flagellar biosynthesis protein FlgM [Sulfurimonas sp. RIFOXYB2_FULL_37_5]OHE15998.1 MAG: flagellar biosynthesis protein FlgM [Sulfurimonas sp. RIFOXYD2_FULL_37_8]OHE18456.1 MAG: flagellar biosynthesis protein FlgM [Sulfurimonas sp. RIFOXYD12_FULL_36_11]